MIVDSGGGTKNPLNTGRDLADIFNSEIAKYASAWQWMKDRIDIGCYTGLHDEDFLPMTLTTGEAHEMQIAGINTYTRTTDQNLGNHIDFISRNCYSQPVQWNIENSNNGTAEEVCPYLASNIYKFLNNDLYSKLPQEIKSIITPKITVLEERYSSSGVLKDSTLWAWKDIGYLWLPSEYEVFGSVVQGTKGWSSGQATQYPIFANSWKNRIKSVRANGDGWWLLTVAGDEQTYVCFVDDKNGTANRRNVLETSYVPICFRIAAHQ